MRQIHSETGQFHLYNCFSSVPEGRQSCSAEICPYSEMFPAGETKNLLVLLRVQTLILSRKEGHDILKSPGAGLFRGFSLLRHLKIVQICNTLCCKHLLYEKNR